MKWKWEGMENECGSDRGKFTAYICWEPRTDHVFVTIRFCQTDTGMSLLPRLVLAFNYFTFRNYYARQR